MRIFSSDPFVLPLPERHRFPMEKYVLLGEAVEDSLPRDFGSLAVPAPATDEELETVHAPDYVIRVSDGISVNLSGGTHHAFPDRGEGFCVFNDVAVAARVLQREGLARRIGIVDLDVHQGNGTAFIFRDDPDVFTLSVHGANNYPFRKEPSDLDLELPDGAGDGPFLEATRMGVERGLRGRHFHHRGDPPQHRSPGAGPIRRMEDPRPSPSLGVNPQKHLGSSPSHKSKPGALRP